jgi:preprotein translocase subunit YajC
MAALIPLVLMLALTWALLVRPQQQRVRRHAALLQSLAEGDEVFVGGGIRGRIIRFDGDEARVEVAPGVELRVLRRYIGGRVETEAESDAEPDAEAG